MRLRYENFSPGTQEVLAEPYSTMAAKIDAALAKVGKLHSDPKERGKEADGKDEKDLKSPTFAELIAKGKLPGGDLEKLLEEPKEEKDAAEGESQEPAGE